MSGEDLYERVMSVRELFPEAQVEVDNDGQIIIYTGEYQEVKE